MQQRPDEGARQTRWAATSLSTIGLLSSLGYWAIAGFIALVELLGDCPANDRHCRSSSTSQAWLFGSTIGAVAVYIALVAATRWCMRRWRDRGVGAGEERSRPTWRRTLELALIPPGMIFLGYDLISSLSWGFDIVSRWPATRLVGLALSAFVGVLLVARWYRVAPPRLGCAAALILAAAAIGLAAVR